MARGPTADRLHDMLIAGRAASGPATPEVSPRTRRAFRYELFANMPGRDLQRPRQLSTVQLTVMWHMMVGKRLRYKDLAVGRKAGERRVAT